eukprot:NODE_23215_length_676_cov_1.096539.p1 GENE.NODE_23215_length_676_cov_1.096539~~NODE_23215_length_676_cov_1.096539.p1  ORF type:complete len:217 (+),score=62.94 NODE_23215_length_676_cov_1.096539:89-652(+)
MSPEALELESPVFHERGPASVVEFVKNNHMELVGKTLAAMRVEAFLPLTANFQIGWKARSVAAVDGTKVYELLHEVCCSETSPPSFLVFTNFVKFLGHLTEMAEKWNLQDLALLQIFDPGLRSFKHCLTRLLIETSRDFSLRHLPLRKATRLLHKVASEAVLDAPQALVDDLQECQFLQLPLLSLLR